MGLTSKNGPLILPWFLPPGTEEMKNPNEYRRPEMHGTGIEELRSSINLQIRSDQRFNTLLTAKLEFEVLAMEADRLNSPSTFTMTMEVLGHELRFYQDPNSKHLGTTVWDASLVFVKFLERNCRKGKFSSSKLKGKRVIELGAGCGLAGFGMALLGCDVVATDQREVLPILSRNIERNTPSLAQMNPSDSFGSIRAAELDWGNEDHIKAVGPPFDFIIGTDVVYAEHLLEPLLKTIHALSGPKTTIMLGYEIRSTNVHEQMLEMWKKNFEVKTVSQSKMDSQYQHPSIQLYIMGLKSGAGNAKNTQGNVEQEIDTVCSRQENDEKDVSFIDEKDASCDERGVQKTQEPVTEHKDKKLGDWEARRMGSMAARLLQDVKIV